MYYQLRKVKIINNGNEPKPWYSNVFGVSYLKYMHDTVASFIVRNGYDPEWTDDGISVTVPTWESAVALERALDTLALALETLDDLKNIDIPDKYKQAWDNAINYIEYIETVERGLHIIDQISDCL